MTIGLIFFPTVESSVVTLDFIESTFAIPNATSKTFSSIGLGTAASDRIIVVGVGSNSGAGGHVISGVTVAGDSATEIVSIRDAETRASIYAVALSSGTSGDVVVSTDNNSEVMGIGVYAMFGASITPTDTDSTINPVQDLGLSVAKGGVAIAHAHDTSAQNGVTWTGLTERYDEVMNGANIDQTGASKAFSAADGSLAITTTNRAGGADNPIVAASFQPA
tara:strand:+ start:30 stop:692 length:663 start_codon:yes stop_codon:yes gene_type:complete